MTANYDADKKQRISTGLGGLLAAANVIEFSGAQNSKAKAAAKLPA